jgi:hypothetical protein
MASISTTFEPALRLKPFGWRHAAGVFIAALFAINFALVLGIRTGQWDAHDFFAPYFTLVADAARQGEILQWSPLVNGGAPVGCDPQVGAASPLILLMGLITGGGEFGFRLYWLSVWMLGGIGILFLAKHLGAAPWIACIAAVGYSHSAIYIAHAEHTCHLFTMSMFPWVLWRLDAALTRPSLFAGVQAGVLWGLSALGGYPGLLLGGAGYAVVWSVGRLLFPPASKTGGEKDFTNTTSISHNHLLNGSHPVIFSLIVLTVFFLTGFAVLSPSYASFLVEARGYTGRADAVPKEQVLREGSLSPLSLGTIASPYPSIWNYKSPERIWTADVALSSIYVSPLLLALAISAFMTRGDRRFCRFLQMAGLFLLLVALGGFTPLYGWLYDICPPIRFFRFPALFRCYYILTVIILAVLACVGMERQSEKARAAFWNNLSWVALVASMIALLCFLVIAWLLRSNQVKVHYILLAIIHGIAVWSAVTALAFRGRRRGPLVCQRIVRRSWVMLAIADAAVTMLLSQQTVYAKPQAWQELSARHVASLDLTERGLDRRLAREDDYLPLCGNLVTKVPELLSHASMTNSLLTQYAYHPILGPSAAGPERIWFSPDAPRLLANKQMMQRYVAAVERIGRPAIVISEPFQAGSQRIVSDTDETEIQEPLSDLAPAECIPVDLVEYTSNRLSFDVQSPCDGWLLVTDRWAAGWQAAVNDQEAKVWIGNFIFRAVHITQGANRVTFKYRPFGHPWLMILSWTCMGVVLTGTACSKLASIKRGQSHFR